MTESTSTIGRIKQKLDIVEEIGAVVPLRKSGRAFKGLCPFHSERTPSFYVFPEKATWHCFGCNEFGDIFTFVQKQQGLDFREALQVLAERAGVPLEGGASGADGADEPSPETTARKRLRAVNEAAAIWLHHQLLQAPEAQYARVYLDSRGVNSESIATWRLGYAPDGDRLSTYLAQQGYTAAELVEAGLAREREATRGGGVYDYFRNRLIFPIRDIRGQTIAFGGRELGGGHPKYLNSPQTRLFDKSATLFGLDLARQAIARGDRVIVVEGYVDAVVTHQFGTRNVVAVIGSALTERHVQQIKKLTRRLTLALDPDAAGAAATLRGIEVAQQAFDRAVVPVPVPADGGRTGRRGEPRGLVRFESQVDAEITILRLPPGVDPDEYVRQDPEGWQRAIAEALPLIEYLFDVQTADLALDAPEGKAEAAHRLLPAIAEIKDRTAQDAYLRRLAARLRVDERELALDFQRVRRQLAREGHQHDARQRPERQPPEAAAGQPANGAEANSAIDGALGEKYRGDSLDHQARPDAGYSAPATPRFTLVGGLATRLLAERAQEEYCLGLLIDRPIVWSDMSAILEVGDFASTEMRELYRLLADPLRGAGPGAFDPVQWIESLPPILQDAVERARARLTLGVPEEGTGLVKVASHAAYRLKRMRLGEEMAELDYLQRDAEQSGDRDTLRTLLGRKQQLLSQRRAIDAAAALYG
ncbi:MAG TPA: DNA primase [Ktedonobacterales bacterium]